MASPKSTTKKWRRSERLLFGLGGGAAGWPFCQFNLLGLRDGYRRSLFSLHPSADADCLALPDVTIFLWKVFLRRRFDGGGKAEFAVFGKMKDGPAASLCRRGDLPLNDLIGLHKVEN